MTINQWPQNWDDLITGIDCSMCRDNRPTNDIYGIRIHSGPYTDAILQRAKIQYGYTLVIWNGRHVNDPTELDQREAMGYWQEVLLVSDCLLRYYRPLKMNYQTLGNSLPHLHTHLIPRYRDNDPNPGWIFPIPKLTPNFPVIPDAQLQQQAQALQALLDNSKWNDNHDKC